MAAEGAPPAFAPMKAVTGPLPADDDAWSYEVKWDGVRAIVTVRDGAVRITSANGRDITVSYPELAALGAELAGHTCVLDGEIVAFDDRGRPDFGLLAATRLHIGDPRRAAEAAAAQPVVLVLFDLLWLDGLDATPLPYEQRRRLLEELIEPGSHWQVPAAHVGDGQARLDAVADAGLEGLVAKRLGSPYLPGRRSALWRKLKVRQEQEMVVGGWRPGEGGRAGTIGSLLVGTYDHGRLRYAGRVGSGFTDRELRRLEPLLASVADDVCPFDPPPPRADAAGARWCRPELVAQVAFAEWSRDGRLRHPSYRGLRDDKDAAEVVRDDLR